MSVGYSRLMGLEAPFPVEWEQQRIALGFAAKPLG
jgi:hypothetical protein